MREVEQKLWDYITQWMFCPVCGDPVHESWLEEHTQFHIEQGEILKRWAIETGF